MDRRAGRPAFVPTSAVETITELQERLRVEEALRTVLVASPDAFAAPPPPAAPTPAAPAPTPVPG